MTDLYVSLGDLQAGVARFGCPRCFEPLVVRLPSMPEPTVDHGSAALRLGMDELTMMQRRAFDAIYATFPLAIEAALVSEHLGQSPLAFRVLRNRMLPRLAVYGWRLLLKHGSLRLIEPPQMTEVTS